MNGNNPGWGMRDRSRVARRAGAWLLLVAALAGCATEKGDWEKAQAANTAAAYRGFLQHLHAVVPERVAAPRAQSGGEGPLRAHLALRL